MNPASEEDYAVNAIRGLVSTSGNPASRMTQLHNAGHVAPMFAVDPILLLPVTDWTAKVLR